MSLLFSFMLEEKGIDLEIQIGSVSGEKKILVGT